MVDAARSHSLLHTHINTHTHTPSLSHTHTDNTHTSLSQSHTVSLSLSLSLSNTHTHTHTRTHNLYLNLSQTKHSHTYTRTCTHALAHLHTHTHIYTHLHTHSFGKTYLYGRSHLYEARINFSFVPSLLETKKVPTRTLKTHARILSLLIICPDLDHSLMPNPCDILAHPLPLPHLTLLDPPSLSSSSLPPFLRQTESLTSLSLSLSLFANSLLD